jgi:hypothetical protein
MPGWFLFNPRRGWDDLRRNPICARDVRLWRQDAPRLLAIMTVLVGMVHLGLRLGELDVVPRGKLAEALDIATVAGVALLLPTTFMTATVVYIVLPLVAALRVSGLRVLGRLDDLRLTSLGEGRIISGYFWNVLLAFPFWLIFIPIGLLSQLNPGSIFVPASVRLTAPRLTLGEVLATALFRTAYPLLLLAASVMLGVAAGSLTRSRPLAVATTIVALLVVESLAPALLDARAATAYLFWPEPLPARWLVFLGYQLIVLVLAARLAVRGLRWARD